LRTDLEFKTLKNNKELFTIDFVSISTPALDKLYGREARVGNRDARDEIWTIEPPFPLLIIPEATI
jgi:hypothetical protein